MPRHTAAAIGLAVLLCFSFEAKAEFQTLAREAILIDTSTNTVLFDKDADLPMPPASMSKIMTAFMVFEKLSEGSLSLDDTFTVSEKAWRKGGSKMFVEVGKQIRVEDLLRGVIVQSGNDASIVLAEGLSGSEEAFAEAMTEKAREIGLTNSSFANATGWPHERQRMSARDLATLAQLIIEKYPEYYAYYSEKEFTWNGIRQGNRNPLLYRNTGADGLKTGHTEEAGYGLTASAERNGRRLIMVATGLGSMKERGRESQRILDWGFREFNNYSLFKAGESVETADVWLGDAMNVPLTSPEDIVVTLPRKARKDMAVTVIYEQPVPAPIQEGDQIGILRVTAPEVAPREFPLYAGHSVEQLGPFGRVVSALMYFVTGAP